VVQPAATNQREEASVNRERSSVKAWVGIALAAVGFSVVAAFAAGFFLGHFTGNSSTTTVAATAPGEVEAEEGAEEETEAVEEEGGEEVEEEGTEQEVGAAEEEGEEEAGEPEEEKEEAAKPGNAEAGAEAGAEVFAENCSICHGATGHGGNGGPDLRTMPKAKTEAGAIEQVTNGGGGMPPFKGVLSEEEIKAVAAYVVNTIVGG
jgi:cytochrome c6